MMFWTCTNRSLTCEIRSGTDSELILHLDNRLVDNAMAKTISRKIATNRWMTEESMLFNCTAKNNISEQRRTMTINCSGAWQALVRNPELSLKTQSTRSRAETHSSDWVSRLGGSLGSG